MRDTVHQADESVRWSPLSPLGEGQGEGRSWKILSSRMALFIPGLRVSVWKRTLKRIC